MKMPPDHHKAPHVTTKGHTPHQRDIPPLLIPVATIGNVNKPMNFNSAIMVTQSLIIHKQNRPDPRFSYLKVHTLFGFDVYVHDQS